MRGELGVPGIGPVDTDLVCLCGVLTQVLYMAQYVAPTVLAEKVAKMGSQAHICSCRLL